MFIKRVSLQDHNKNINIFYLVLFYFYFYFYFLIYYIRLYEMPQEKQDMPGLKGKQSKPWISGMQNIAVVWAIVIVVCVLLITVYSFNSMRYLKSMTTEKYVSYSGGANQRFEQRNSDPTLGRQFAPYNMEITGQKALFGKNQNPYERLSSSREAPVIYNIGSDMGGQPYPPAVSVPYPNRGNAYDRNAPEAGLSPNGDSAVANAEGTPGDGAVEDLISELYG